MDKKEILLELLYFKGCPGYERAWADILEVAVENDLEILVRARNIDSLEKANGLPFAGSPTILVNGIDLENYQGETVMACRIYRENDNKGWPGKELLKRALERGQMGVGSSKPGH